MIGDKCRTEALDCYEIRFVTMVGERCVHIEAEAEATVESTQVRMQT